MPWKITSLFTLLIKARSRAAFALSGVFAFVALSFANAEELRVPRHCPADVPTCVMVDLNLVWPNNERLDIPQHPLVIEDTPTAEDQFRLTRLTVSGRLNGLDIELHDVMFERFYDGMDCQDFTVPAIGFGGNKGGIILTDKGPLEITQPNINVGCDNCVAMIDGPTNDHATFLQTPAWDQHVAGYSVFKKDGGVYWMAEQICFDLNSGTHFKVVDSKRCIKDKLLPVRPETIEVLKDVLPEADANRLKHDLNMIEGAPFFFYRYGISCS